LSDKPAAPPAPPIPAETALPQAPANPSHAKSSYNTEAKRPDSPPPSRSERQPLEAFRNHLMTRQNSGKPRPSEPSCTKPGRLANRRRQPDAPPCGVDKIALPCR